MILKVDDSEGPKKENILREDSFKEPIPLTPKQNLESKIECLIRSLENLSAKKARIELQIKMQKRSLARKREELKRVSKSVSGKARISFESKINSDFAESLEDRKRTQLLLSESARILEE